MDSLSRGADLRSFGVRFQGGTAQPGVPFVPPLSPSSGHGHSLVGTVPSLKPFPGNGCRDEGLCQQPRLIPCHSFPEHVEIARQGEVGNMAKPGFPGRLGFPSGKLGFPSGIPLEVTQRQKRSGMR